MKLTVRFALLVLICTLTLPLANPARGDVKLPAIFSDHMVLQQQMPVPVWGWADPGEQVTVTLNDQRQTATAGDDRKWQVKLGPLQAGGPLVLKITGKNAVEFQDVLAGEVWVCSGQSNMEFSVAGAKNSKEEIHEANYPQIRLFTVPKAVAGKPMKDTHGTWSVCKPETVPGFSAVGYFFGRDLHAALNVPVGLIHSSWGGTPAETWTPKSVLESEPDLKVIADRWQQQIDDFNRQLNDLPKRVEDWKEQSNKAEEQGLPIPAIAIPPDPRTNPWRAGGLYNGMIAPIVPYAIRGAIWYQGESNAGRAYQYRKLLPAMIQSWRAAWEEPDFTFLIVSLANFTNPVAEPGESDWAELREAQALTAAQPHNGQALAIDLADTENPGDIHPHNKQEVGRRLSLAAEALTYDKQVEYSGPWYGSMSTDGDKIRLTFKHVSGGLQAKGGEPLKGFAIAGEDHHWHWADARIEGETVIVHSDQVPHPVAVRYAWAHNPIANLYNQAGLPAVPFRTDPWKAITADSK